MGIDFLSDLKIISSNFPVEVSNCALSLLNRVSYDYEKKKRFQFKPSDYNFSKIEPYIHFIWLGPKKFPQESLLRLKDWKQMNPDFRFIFWTDRQRGNDELEGVEIEIRMVTESVLPDLWRCYLHSSNYGEKSDIVRYEIIKSMGGIYVDHDVECIRSIKPLVDGYDFFVSLEGLDHFHRWRHWEKTDYYHGILCSNSIFGAAKEHPVLHKLVKHIDNKWDAVTAYWQEFKGQNSQYVSSLTWDERVILRTYIPFTKIILDNMQDLNYSIIVPAAYFSTYFIFHKNKAPIYGKHLFQSSWNK
jgi:Glycosyltransferase sugar-binding region containing DXD motif